MHEYHTVFDFLYPKFGKLTKNQDKKPDKKLNSICNFIDKILTFIDNKLNNNSIHNILKNNVIDEFPYYNENYNFIKKWIDQIFLITLNKLPSGVGGGGGGGPGSFPSSVLESGCP